MAGMFVCYERTETGHGRITSSATIVDHVSYAQELESAGRDYLFVPIDGWTGFFTLDSDGNPAEIHLRERFTGTLDKPEIAMMEIATIADVPPCQVRFSGPMTERIVVHQGGDLQMRFAVPGQYTIAFEAFPLLPFESTLTVRKPETTAPEVR